MSAPAAQLTSLLGNAQIARLEQMRIQSSRRFTSRNRGEHRSRGGGRSIEFKDYRDYVEGDDIRFLDWNIFARLRRPYVKLFHDEEEQWVVLLLDASTSMTFEGKLPCALRLAAAFGLMGLLGGERVMVSVFGAPGVAPALRVPRGRKGRTPLFRFLEQVEGGGSATLDAALDALAKRHRGRGVLIILSDFLTAGDLRAPLGRAHGLGLEPFGLQILGPQELQPELPSDLRLVDAETGEMLDVSATDDLLALYDEHRTRMQRGLETLCRQRDGKWLALDASTPLDELLFGVLRRRGWVR